MVSFYSLYIVPIITGILIFGTITWIMFLLFYYFPKKLGVGRLYLIWRLKSKFKSGFEYNDETIQLCQTALARGWQLKDMMLITKKSPHRDEILYTFFMMSKLKKKGFNPELYHEKQGSNIKFLEDVVKKLK